MTEGTQPPQPLRGRVALVAGATRGAGRGIARMLGEAGAVVWCTGRGTRERPSAEGAYAGRPETIEETAALVDAAGGEGIAVRVDHASEKEVAALVRRIERERGRLDLLVNVLGSPPMEPASAFWKLPLAELRARFDAYVWPHIVTARAVAPGMVKRRGGLLVEILESRTLGYHAPFFYDLGPLVLKRLAYAVAEEGAPHGVAAVAVAPGFMRTEMVLAHFGTTEDGWREAARTSAGRSFGLAGSETPCFVGRAVAALAADPATPVRWSGAVTSSWELSEAYGFDDVDGGRPHWGRYFAEHFPALAGAEPLTGVDWRQVRR